MRASATRSCPALLAAAFLLASCAASRLPPPAAAPRAEGARRIAGTGESPSFPAYGRELALQPTALERASLEAARARLGRGGQAALSPALLAAARELALGASRGVRDPLSRARVRAALARAAAFDPAPAAHLVAASPASAAAALQATLVPGPATHLAAGAVERNGRAWVVLLVSRRTAALEPFPRDVPSASTLTFAGKLTGLQDPSLHVTTPAGQSRRLESWRGTEFRTEVRLDAPGRWLLEVVGRGPRGPEVAALVAVSVDGAALDEPASEVEEPDVGSVAEAEAEVVRALNATRGRHRLPRLTISAELSRVARRHSEEMLARGEVAHLLGGLDVAGRLRRERVPYRLALENVARGSSALAAHRGVEESPAHRENLLSPSVSRVGCGVARGKLVTGEPVTYLTEILLGPVQRGGDGGRAPEDGVREAIWRERARTGGPSLIADPALDALAAAAARAMRSRGEPSAGEAGDQALQLGRKVASVDAFAATAVEDAARSRNVGDVRFRRVGVGVATGDSARYGAGLLFIAVVYTD